MVFIGTFFFVCSFILITVFIRHFEEQSFYFVKREFIVYVLLALLISSFTESCDSIMADKKDISDRDFCKRFGN